jgi:hypothetical protein
MAARIVDSVEQVRVFQRLKDGHGSLSPSTASQRSATGAALALGDHELVSVNPPRRLQ